MRIRHAVLVSTLLAASSLALAQGAGAGGGGGAGPAGNDPNANNATSTREGGDANATPATTPATHHPMKKHSKAKKPMTDTTNTPGADASSDTKGQ